MMTNSKKQSCNGNRISGFFATSLTLMIAMVPCLNSVIGAELKVDDLFRSDHLLEIQIKMLPSDWSKLRKESDRGNGGFGRIFGGSPSSGNRFNLYKADITIDGNTISSVGVRTKGFIGSLNPERPSLKVKFDEYLDQSPVAGLDRLTLNNNVQDESLASQYLTYKLFNKAGVPAPRVSYAKVTVNGEYLGVYTHVESVRGPFIKRHFGDYSGEFYEGTIADFYPKAVENIEAKNKHTEKDRTQAKKLAQVLETKESFNLAKAEKYVNVDQFIKFWAMESLLGFWDGYTNNQNNYYAYASPKDDMRFHFMPWGADGAFTEGRGPFSRFRGDGNEPKAVYTQSMLANRLFQLDGIPNRYKAALEDILMDVWNEEEIKDDVKRIHALTRNHLHPRQDRIDQGISRLIAFVEDRRSSIESELQDWPVQVQNGPRIPRYSVEIGKLKGWFDTAWKSERLRDVTGLGKAELELTLNGEQVTFSSLGVLGQPEEPRRWFGGRGRGRSGQTRKLNPTITFQGVSEDKSQQVKITLTINREDFESGKKDVPFQGSLTVLNADENQNEFGFGRSMSMKTLDGAFKLSEAEMNEGGTVAGTLKMNINESRGGFNFGEGRSRGLRR
jgi:spore coat protein CotH